MASSYALFVYRDADREGHRAALTQSVAQGGGSVIWNEPGDGVEDLRLGTFGGVQTVFIPYHGGKEFEVAVRIAVSRQCYWLVLRIQEECHWDYALRHGGTLIDKFSTWPQYFAGEEYDDAYADEWKGKPDELARAWGIPQHRVERYLVNWGYRVDEQEGELLYDLRELEGKKAYPYDEFMYGQYQQLFDLLRELGGGEPNEKHRMQLPV